MPDVAQISNASSVLLHLFFNLPIDDQSIKVSKISKPGGDIRFSPGTSCVSITPRLAKNPYSIENLT